MNASLATILLLTALPGQTLDNDNDFHARDWPLWDGKESVQSYARRVGLPPNRTIDLGGNEKLELALIPAGRFLMGSSFPQPPAQPRETVVVGQAIMAGGLILFFTFMVAVIWRMIRESIRPQFTLGRLLLFTLSMAVVLYGCVRWYRVEYAWTSFQRDLIKYRSEVQSYAKAHMNEKPAHPVVISAPFYLGTHEVTQEQLTRIGQLARAAGKRFGKTIAFGGKRMPATFTSTMAREFCYHASKTSGRMLLLPTEAQWEYACRAGTRTRFYTGDEEKSLYRAAWFDGNSKRKPHPVGTLKPNAFGLYDMLGNLSELCWDHLESYAPGLAVDPLYRQPRGRQVTRGGNYRSVSGQCAAVTRHEKSYIRPGVRVAMEVDPTRLAARFEARYEDELNPRMEFFLYSLLATTFTLRHQPKENLVRLFSRIKELLITATRQKVEEAISRLSHPDTRVQKKAHEELWRFGRICKEQLQKALKEERPTYARFRIRQLLSDFRAYPMRWRNREGVRLELIELLGRIPRPEARSILDVIAERSPSDAEREAARIELKLTGR